MCQRRVAGEGDGGFQSPAPSSACAASCEAGPGDGGVEGVLGVSGRGGKVSNQTLIPSEVFSLSHSD